MGHVLVENPWKKAFGGRTPRSLRPFSSMLYQTIWCFYSDISVLGGGQGLHSPSWPRTLYVDRAEKKLVVLLR